MTDRVSPNLAVPETGRIGKTPHGIERSRPLRLSHGLLLLLPCDVKASPSAASMLDSGWGSLTGRAASFVNIGVVSPSASFSSPGRSRLDVQPDIGRAGLCSWRGQPPLLKSVASRTQNHGRVAAVADGAAALLKSAPS